MNTKELVLAALSVAKGSLHRPVQLQKLFFLIDQEIPSLVGGPHFDFKPYNYGPFDRRVYEVLDNLVEEGLAESILENNWHSYRLTPQGQQLGESLFASMDPVAQDYIMRASDFVRRLSFSQLVKAIYKQYPEMRVNSVFQN
jgi:hypothetical protein